MKGRFRAAQTADRVHSDLAVAAGYAPKMLPHCRHICWIHLARPYLEEPLALDLGRTGLDRIARLRFEPFAPAHHIVDQLPHGLPRTERVGSDRCPGGEGDLVGSLPQGPYRQRQPRPLRRPPVDLVAAPIRRRPQIGKIRAGDRQADAVPLAEAPGRRVEVDVQRVNRPRLQRLRIVQRRAAGAIEHPAANQRAGAVGRHVTQSDDENHHRGGRRGIELDLRPATDFQVLRQRLGAIGQRVHLIGPLVGGQPEGHPATPQPTADPDRGAIFILVVSLFTARRSLERQQPLGAQFVHALFAALRLEIRLRPPVTAGLSPRRQRLVVGLHVDLHRGLVHHPVVLVLEPVVAPAHHFAQPVDPRTGNRHIRPRVIPRPHQQPLRHLQRSEGAQRRIGIAVAPAADHKHRALYLLVAAANTARPPVRPIGRVR